MTAHQSNHYVSGLEKVSTGSTTGELPSGVLEDLREARDVEDAVEGLRFGLRLGVLLLCQMVVDFCDRC